MARKTIQEKAKPPKSRPAKVAAAKPEGKPTPPRTSELVILTGLSGSGKASALKAFEDLGYYSVDNLPLELLPRFADLVRQSAEIDRAPPLVVDVREGQTLERFPTILQQIQEVARDNGHLSRGQRGRPAPPLLPRPGGPTRWENPEWCAALSRIRTRPA